MPARAPTASTRPDARRDARRGGRRGGAIGAVVGVLLLATAVALGAHLLVGGPSGAVPPASSGEPAAQAPPSEEPAQNGRLDRAALVAIDAEGSYLLVPEAAAAFAELRLAAEGAGFALAVNSAYRDYDEQVALAEELGLLEDGGLAAPPGESEHGWGISVDLTLGPEALEWMLAHAHRYGFTRTIAGEPWHWTYTG